MTTPPTLAPSTALPGPLPLGQRLWALWQRQRGWLWADVLSVFLLTRLALVGIALFAPTFPGNPVYPDPGVVERGWQFTPIYLIDVWARWDSGWYLDIVNYGYAAPSDLHAVQSNLAFFPVFPLLVKGLSALVPAPLQSPATTLLLGVLLSNAFLLGALALLRPWVARLTGDPAVARRTVLYLLLFPTGFFLSAFYTESTFLFFSVAALFAAQRRAWGWAGAAGALLTLSRPLGIVITLPLAWQYAAAAGWDWRKLRWDAAWLALPPLCLLGYFVWQYQLTGNFFAPLYVQQAWGRTFSWPWEALLHPVGLPSAITPLEQGLAVVFVVGALLALRRLPSRSLGLYALVLIAPPLFTGQLLSTARYYLAVVPVFVVAAQLGKHPLVDRAITLFAPMMQALLFLLWCRFYWVA